MRSRHTSLKWYSKPTMFDIWFLSLFAGCLKKVTPKVLRLRCTLEVFLFGKVQLALHQFVIIHSK